VKKGKVGDDDEDLKAAIRQALATLAQERSPALAEAIGPIVRSNIDRGRLHFFLSREDQPGATSADYVSLIAGYYEELHDYVHQLQDGENPDLWQSLYAKFQWRAYCLLASKGIPRAIIIHLEYHVECAGMAAAELLRARFPYDTEFDPWAEMILQHAVYKLLGRLKRWRRDESDPALPEDLDAWWKRQEDQNSLEAQESIELSLDLLAAIEQLPADQKEVFLLREVKHLEYTEIAAALDKTLNAVYQLHFKARKNLRKILGSQGDNNK
jgi:RNA polymerase sigma factor (sigma-70 family)